MSSIDLIKKLCAKNNISIARLEKILGYGNGSLSKSKTIKAERLAEIADYFGVPVSELFPEKLKIGSVPSCNNSHTMTHRHADIDDLVSKFESDEELADYLSLTLSLSCDDFKTVHSLLRSLVRKN